MEVGARWIASSARAVYCAQLRATHLDAPSLLSSTSSSSEAKQPRLSLLSTTKERLYVVVCCLSVVGLLFSPPVDV